MQIKNDCRIKNFFTIVKIQFIPEFFRLTNSRTKALSKTVHSLPSRLSLPFDYSAVMLSHKNIFAYSKGTNFEDS